VKTQPLALSLGDPAGIGPEITVKAWRALKDSGRAFLAVGDHEVLAAAATGGEVPLKRVAGAHEVATVFPHALPVLDLPLPANVVAGHPDPAHAAAVIRWIETAAGLALSGDVAGVVTAPIAKAPLYAAHGVPEYWVINAATLVTTVQKQPPGNTYAFVREIVPDTPLVPSLAPALTVSLNALVLQ
jgi:4-hydroxy-L-threonine phosphate dehydrogenase PdxA